jgi:hypothetical protein
MERKMKLLAVTAISALALVAAVPALAGDPELGSNNTAKAEQAIPGDQNATNSDQTALNDQKAEEQKPASTLNGQNTQTALNNQESVDQAGVTPSEQSGNQNPQDQSQTALNDQNANPDQTNSQTGPNDQMALNDQNDHAGISAEDQATVDTGAIARNDAIDPNVQRMNQAAQEKAGQMDSDQAEAGKLKDPNNTTPPTEE